MAISPFAKRELPEESYKERRPEFSLILMSAITRCNWYDWQVQKGWIKSDLEQRKYHAATEGLLRLAYEMITYDETFFDKQLIVALEKAYYGEKFINGYPTEPVLVALETTSYEGIKEINEYEIAGFYGKDDTGKETLIGIVKFQQLRKLLNNAIKKIFGYKKPFNNLLHEITIILNNRYRSSVETIKQTIADVNEFFSFEKYTDLIAIVDDVKLASEENNYYHIENKDTNQLADFTPQSSPDATKKDYIQLSNNPFQAVEIFAGLSINVTELTTRYLHIEQVIAFEKLGLRVPIYGKKKDEEKKFWLEVYFKDQKKKDSEGNETEELLTIDSFYKLQPYLTMVNTLITNNEVIEEKKALLETKAALEACMRKTTSIIYAITSYILGYRPLEAGGGLESFDKEGLFKE